MPRDKQQSALTIRILGRDYSVACPEGERESLLKSAEYLSRRMQSIKRKGKTLGMERIAVMAALNIARDLIAAQRSLAHNEHRPDPGLPASANEIGERLTQLQRRVEATLEQPG